MTDLQISPEKHYSAALDSVNLINELVAKSDRTGEDNDAITRNAEHLEIMLGKDFWTNEDLEPFKSAIAAAKG